MPGFEFVILRKFDGYREVSTPHLSTGLSTFVGSISIAVNIFRIGIYYKEYILCSKLLFSIVLISMAGTMTACRKHSAAFRSAGPGICPKMEICYVPLLWSQFVLYISIAFTTGSLHCCIFSPVIKVKTHCCVFLDRFQRFWFYIRLGQHTSPLCLVQACVEINSVVWNTGQTNVRYAL